MKHLIHAIAICCLLACSAIPARAQTSYPMLMSLQPTAAQVGTDSEHEVESRYSMFGAYQVIVHGEGVTGEIITPMELGKDGKEPSLTKIKVKFHIAADAIPGVRDFRIIGPTGASTLGRTPRDNLRNCRERGRCRLLQIHHRPAQDGQLPLLGDAAGRQDS